MIVPTTRMHMCVKDVGAKSLLAIRRQRLDCDVEDGGSVSENVAAKGCECSADPISGVSRLNFISFAIVAEVVFGGDWWGDNDHDRTSFPAVVDMTLCQGEAVREGTCIRQLSIWTSRWTSAS